MCDDDRFDGYWAGRADAKEEVREAVYEVVAQWANDEGIALDQTAKLDALLAKMFTSYEPPHALLAQDRSKSCLYSIWSVGLPYGTEVVDVSWTESR